MTAIGILSFEQMRGRPELGSSLFRAHWLVKYWEEAEIFTLGRRYSAVLFQKAYWIQYCNAFCGLKVLDVCDPDFLNWRSPCIDMANACHAVTTSTPLLASSIASYTSVPVSCIPDRVDLQYFRTCAQKVHRGRAAHVAWFGYSSNYPALEAAIQDVVDVGITKLTVISEPGSAFTLPKRFIGALNVTHYTWELSTVPIQLIQADIILNYRLDFGRWRYKSNNKSLFSWGLGLPAAHTPEELLHFMPEENRAAEARTRWLDLEENYDVRRSVMEFKNILNTITV